MSQPSSSARTRNAPLELTIRNRGLLDAGVGGLLLLLLIAATAVAVGIAAAPEFGLLAAALLILVSWRSITPITYEFGPLGVAQRAPGLRPRRIAWTEMGRVEFMQHGLAITVDPDQPMGPLRSVYIRYCGQRSRLEEVVTTYVEAHQRRTETQDVGSTADFSVSRR